MKGKEKNLRGAVLYGPPDVPFEKRDVPTITKPTDAIIRILATCVCGSDLWPTAASTGRQADSDGPEQCGIVEQVGNAVSSIKPRQLVIGLLFAFDNTCPSCQVGYQSSCQHAELVCTAQAPQLRVPLADGNLVVSLDVLSKGMIPSLLAFFGVIGARMVGCQCGQCEAWLDGGGRR